MKPNHGFTLIEVMVVVSILTAFMTMALPLYQQRILTGQLEEALHVATPIREAVNDFYKENQTLPGDLQALGMPDSQLWRGNFVSKIEVQAGAIHITLGQRAHQRLHAKTVSLRPAIVAEAAVVPIAWVCGQASVPEGMTASADNQTDVPIGALPLNCRI